MLRTMVQSEKWDAVLDGRMLPAFGKPRQDAWQHWARALAYANLGKPDAAQEEEREFERSMADFRARTGRAEPPELAVARQELAGHLDLAAGRIDRGLKQLEAASKAERRLTYTEPPYYPRPVAEALAHAALTHSRPALADRGFRIALTQFPCGGAGNPACGRLSGGLGAVK